MQINVKIQNAIVDAISILSNSYLSEKQGQNSDKCKCLPLDKVALEIFCKCTKYKIN